MAVVTKTTVFFPATPITTVGYGVHLGRTHTFNLCILKILTALLLLWTDCILEIFPDWRLDVFDYLDTWLPTYRWAICRVGVFVMLSFCKWTGSRRFSRSQQPCTLCFPRISSHPAWVTLPDLPQTTSVYCEWPFSPNSVALAQYYAYPLGLAPKYPPSPQKKPETLFQQHPITSCHFITWCDSPPVIGWILNTNVLIWFYSSLVTLLK